MRASASSIDGYSRTLRRASVRIWPIQLFMRSYAGVSLIIPGGGPIPSIETTRLTASGCVPVYCKTIPPPSEWPMSVAGSVDTAFMSCARSST